MATHWKHTLGRIATALGKGLLWLMKRLLMLLIAVGRFVVLRVMPALWTWLRDTLFPALGRFYRWLPHRRIVLACAAGIVALAVAFMMLRHPTETPVADTSAATDAAFQTAANEPAEPAVLTLRPAKAAPGAPILLDGLTVAANEVIDVWIGGRQAPMQRLNDGRLLALAPVHLGSDGWPMALPEKQAVEVRRQGAVIGQGKVGLQVTELPRAPGTTSQIQKSLVTIADGYERIFDALPSQGASETAQRRAVVAMLRGLISNGDHSLAAVLAGTSPLLEGGAPDFELADALLASSGAAAYLQAYAEALGPRPGGAGVAQSAPGVAYAMLQWSLPSIGGNPKCKKSGDDYEIACLMQVQGLLVDFSQVFVKPTADGYATAVGLNMAGFSFLEGFDDAAGKAVPVHKIVSALLSVTSLVMDKIAPSLLPASLSRFELDVAKPHIRIHETTRTKLMIAARNHPQTITANDIIDLVKSIIGLPKIDKYFETVVIKVFDYAIDIYFAMLREFDAQRPNASDAVNPGLFTMPAMSWGPVEVTSDDLLQLYSYDESVLSTQESELEWRGESAGRVTARVMPRGPGDRSKILVDNTLCWSCKWSGGAFGTDMPESSKKIAVEFEFTAEPRQGHAPLDVDLRWDVPLAEDKEPIPCTLDFGDGTAVEHIADCTETSSFQHTYPYTSRLKADTGGAYVAKLRLDKSKAEAKVEIMPDWEFKARPATGDAPLDVRFSWNIPWPEDKAAPRCELDPGDGSDRQSFSDCRATDTAEHRFERRGSFVPTLTIIDGSARDTKTAPVSVADTGTCDADLLKHKKWRGTVSYSQKRDVWNKRGEAHVEYSMRVNLGATMTERTRRDNRGVDYLVQYYSPLPQGSGSLSYAMRGYDSRGQLMERRNFSGSGPMQEQTPDMSEDGSTLALTLNAKTCTYSFYLQGQTRGSGEHWRRGEPVEPYSGYMSINAVRGEGLVTSNNRIAGSAPFPVLSKDQIMDNSRESPTYVSEYDSVSSYLGDSSLGNVTVTWDFTPED